MSDVAKPETAPPDEETQEATPAGVERAGLDRAEKVVLGLIFTHLTVRMVAGFFTAYLLARPVAHLLVTAGTTALITGGAYARVGRLELVVVVACALLGLSLADVLYWWAGRRWKARLNKDLTKLFSIPPKRVEQGERLMGKHGGPLLAIRYFQPVPNQVLQLFAGAGGMRLVTYLAWNLAGAALWAGTLIGAGWAAGENAVAVVDAISANALKVTIVLVVVAVGWNTYKQSRRTT